MKKDTSNTFEEGLVMDSHPLTTPTNVLTNCLNGTLITYNGNEFILLNDMGNAKVGTAYLPDGYVPVGMKLYGGIVYVASVNPSTNKSLIGSFPAPERDITPDEETTKTDHSLTIGDISQSQLICSSEFTFHTGDTFELTLKDSSAVSVLASYKYARLEIIGISAGNVDVIKEITTSEAAPAIPTGSTSTSVLDYYNNLWNGSTIYGKYTLLRSGKVGLRTCFQLPESISYARSRWSYTPGENGSAGTGNLRIKYIIHIKDTQGNLSYQTVEKNWTISVPAALGSVTAVDKDNTSNDYHNVSFDNGPTIQFKLEGIASLSVSGNDDACVLSYTIKPTIIYSFSGSTISKALPGFNGKGSRDSYLEGSNKAFLHLWKQVATEKGITYSWNITAYPDDDNTMSTSIEFYDINTKSKSDYIIQTSDADGSYTYTSYPDDDVKLTYRHAYIAKIIIKSTTSGIADFIKYRYLMYTSLYNDFYYDVDDFITLHNNTLAIALRKIPHNISNEFTITLTADDTSIVNAWASSEANKKNVPTVIKSYSYDIEGLLTVDTKSDEYPFNRDYSDGKLYGLFDDREATAYDIEANFDKALLYATSEGKSDCYLYLNRYYRDTSNSKMTTKLFAAMPSNAKIDGLKYSVTLSGKLSYIPIGWTESSWGALRTIKVSEAFLPIVREDTLNGLFGVYSKTDLEASAFPIAIPFMSKSNDTGTTDTGRWHIWGTKWNSNSTDIGDGGTVDCKEERSSSSEISLKIGDYKQQITLAISNVASVMPRIIMLSGGRYGNKALNGGDFLQDRGLSFSYKDEDGDTLWAQKYYWYWIWIYDGNNYQPTNMYGYSLNNTDALIGATYMKNLCNKLKSLFVSTRTEMEVSALTPSNAVILPVSITINPTVCYKPNLKLTTYGSDELWETSINKTLAVMELATKVDNTYTITNQEIKDICSCLSFTSDSDLDPINLDPIDLTVKSNTLQIAVEEALEKGIGKALIVEDLEGNITDMCIDNDLKLARVYKCDINASGVVNPSSHEVIKDYTPINWDNEWIAIPPIATSMVTIMDGWLMRNHNDFIRTCFKFGPISAYEMDKYFTIL